MNNRKSKNDEEREERKTVTIRGIDKDLYRKLLVIAEESGKTVGELMNEAMKLLLALGSSVVKIGEKVAESTVEISRAIGEGIKAGLESTLIISGVNELVVTKKDLESIDKPVSFRAIKRLVFDEDIPYELFDNKVSSIVFCGEVIVPKTYSKLKVLTKCKFVKIVKHKE